MLSSPLSSRNRLPKSPPSSGLKNGEEWLQEARALSLENAPSILIKPFSGRHAAWHAGGIRVGIRVVMVQRFRARCHSVCYSNCYSTHAAIYAPAWSPALSPGLGLFFMFPCYSTVYSALQFPGPENAVFGVNFVLHCVVELPGLL